MVTTYLQPKDPKGKSRPKLLTAKTGAALDAIIPWDDYVEHTTFDPSLQALRLDELMAFSRDLHDFQHGLHPCRT